MPIAGRSRPERAALFLVLGALPGCGNGVAEPIVADPAGEGGAPPLAASAGDTTGTGGTTGSDSTSGAAEILDYCANVEPWAEANVAAEQGIESALNELRAFGVSCDGMAFGEPLPALEPVGALQCAARVHAFDMHERGFFDHINPDGEGPADRFRKAGANFVLFGEVIGDVGTGASLLQGIIRPGGSDCDELLAPRFDAVGVGYYQGLLTIALASLP